MNPPYPLILASASQGRAGLLRSAGFTFAQAPTAMPEPDPEPAADPALHALRLARLKAEAALPRHPGCLVLAADTVAVCDGRFLGKPRDADEAVEMLAFLGGRVHTLVSALAIGLHLPGRPVRIETGEDRASVTLRAWSRERLRAHVDQVKPFFCAGAYALQDGGSAIVARIEGDPSTVIGLPLDLLDRILTRFAPDPETGPSTRA